MSNRVKVAVNNSRFIVPVLIGCAITPVCALVALASAGAGHGSNLAAFVLFPFAMALVPLGDSYPNVIFAVAIAQFPIYGMILGYGNVKRKVNSALMAVLGLHLLGALILPAAALVEAMLPSNRFEEAVRNNDVATARHLLDRGVDPNARLATGPSLLMLACMDGHAELAKLLLDKGADPNLRDTQDKSTALFYAVDFGHKEIVDLLITHGADLNIKNLARHTVLDEALIVRDTHLAYEKPPPNLPYTPEQRARDNQIIALLEAATKSQHTNKGTQ